MVPRPREDDRDYGYCNVHPVPSTPGCELPKVAEFLTWTVLMMINDHHLVQAHTIDNKISPLMLVLVW